MKRTNNNNQDDILQNIANTFGVKYENNGIVFAEIDSYRYKNTESKTPVISGILAYLVVNKGEMEIVIDNKKWKCNNLENNVLIILFLNSVESLKISDDFRGFLLVISRQFMEKAMIGMPRNVISPSDFISRRMYSGISLSPQDIQLIAYSIQKIERNISRQALFRNELLQLSVVEFHYELLNIIMSKNDLKKSFGGRQDDICSQFSTLLFKNIRTEHEVNFYADKLCITPQYLTKTLRRVMGKSANELIAETLASEAKVMLRSSNFSVLQVADALHFSDQSAFGKFFRRHVGISPAKFKRGYMYLEQ